MKRSSRGFTLMEMMVTVALAAVILGIGVPAFRDFNRNNRIIVAANNMLTTVLAARGDAVRRQTTVSMCRTADPTNAAATCGAGSGWIAFVDIDNSCTRTVATEEIVSNAVIDTDVNTASNGTCISFASTGFKRVVAGQPSTQHTLFCDSRRNVARFPGTNDSTARGLEVLPTGRGAVTRKVTEITSWGVGANTVTCP